MSASFSSARHQAALALPTGYRRFQRFTFRRGGVSQVLEPTAGSFTQDARRAGRWDGRLTFTGGVIPRVPSDLLTPFGTRVDVELGLELLDGTVATVPYGTYEIVSAKTNTSAAVRTVEIGLGDLSGPIERYRFETPYTASSSTDLAVMVNNVVRNRTGVSPSLGAAGATLGAARTFGLETGTGPWSEMINVLDGFSRTIWYARDGRIRMGSVVINTALAYPLNPIAAISSDFDSLPANVIVARGEDTDSGKAPVQAVAMDTDPSSPTYAGTGPGTSAYGRVTEYFSSPLITTVGQAQSAANTILSRRVGAGATSTATLPYDPTIDAGDIVTYEGSNYVVDSVTLDLFGQTELGIREV